MDKLNGKLLEALFGAVISDGTAALLAFPKRKDSLSHNFPEKNGLQVDLAEPRFGAREFTLSFNLIGYGREDFSNKYNGLFTELSTPGLQQLFIADHDKTYNVYYLEQRNLKKHTRLSAGCVGVSFDLVFGESDHTANIPQVYLVDEQDRFLIA